MKTRAYMITAAIILIVSGLRAQGFIIPGSKVPGPRLIEHRVDVDIMDQVARVKVYQTFYNPSDRQMEGKYYFPLPEDASITEFEMLVDGRSMKGELLERDKARRIYEDIVRRQIDPALLEYVDRNLFSASIFPIPAREKREIILEYSSLLTYDGNVVKFSYPLRGESLAGNNGIRVTDAPVPLEGGNHKRLPTGSVSQTIAVNIESKKAIKSIYSPSHDIDTSRKGDHRAEVGYEGTRKTVSESFVLYYSYSDKDFGLSLMSYQGDEANGYFMILLSPKSSITEREISGKDILFILDTSGSMAGEKIEQAKDALAYCINNLDNRDRFNIITFSTENRLFKEEMVPVSRYRKEALSFITKTEARGGTNINEALLAGVGMHYDKNRTSSIIFVTDGLPTVGITDAGDIVKNVSDENSKEIKIFTFGVGYDVNTMLLDRIAAESRSVSDYIEPGENLEEVITAFYDKVSHPVMTGLELDFGGARVSDVFPKDLPDLFTGSQLAVFGRFRGRGSRTITLKGMVNGRERSFKYDVRFTEEKDHAFIPHLWATRKIGYLMDEIRLHGYDEELKEEIISLSKKHGVMSPYTSYLVREEGEIADRVIPVAAPAPAGGFSRKKNGRAMEAMAVQSTGASAVRASKVSREMKEADAVQSLSHMQRAGGRTFYLVDTIWTDQEYTDQKTIDIQAGSDAVVNLMLEFPETAKYLALGEKVIFKLNDKFIKIGDKGETGLSREELKEKLK